MTTDEQAAKVRAAHRYRLESTEEGAGSPDGPVSRVVCACGWAGPWASYPRAALPAFADHVDEAVAEEVGPTDEMLADAEEAANEAALAAAGARAWLFKLRRLRAEHEAS